MEKKGMFKVGNRFSPGENEHELLTMGFCIGKYKSFWNFFDKIILWIFRFWFCRRDNAITGMFGYKKR